MLKSFLRRLGGATPRHTTIHRDPFVVMRQLVVQDAPVMLDGGAHIGETAQRLRALFPRAFIHCFEPSPESFQGLAAATADDARIEAHRAALSDRSGSATLHVNRSSATNSLLATDPRGASYMGEGLLDTQRAVSVETRSVDDFCAERGIERLHLLKMDVQGSEYAVLCGARRMLSRQSIDAVYLEIITAPAYEGQRKLHELLALLDSCSYELFDLFHAVRRNGRLVCCEAIVVSPECLRAHEARLGQPSA